ncbi:MAG: CBS domain-containing protein [Crenarchaeota archaeon]|nr:MAG: CBS domain-containing protein [Thermoproteota archaeon]RDJ34586.1 MAG: CBS domain-containing protein [Thermoproteota archaeon]RDJ35893.1 MAG: CBS domain-containing protein [Thermoproteota archaeon]RDJ38470.1 MAG: CBS domain-containing protein [Thermoproteota archaeon]
MAHTFVKDVMNKKIVSIDHNKSIKETAELMSKSDVGCAIITENNSPIGIITERDFVKRIVANNKAGSDLVKEVMSSPLITIDSDETVWEAAEIMKTKNIHKVVATENDTIVGIITTSDLVKICSAGSDSEMRRICDQILLRMEKSQ